MKQLAIYFSIPGYITSLATPSDALELIALINHAFAYQDAAKGKPRIDEAGLFKKMTESSFLIWRDKSYLAACCYIELTRDVVHFGLLCVADDYRGGRLAPTIIGFVERYARLKGSHLLILDYMSQAPWLRQYYEKFGFKVTSNVRDLGWSKLIEMEKSLAP